MKGSVGSRFAKLTYSIKSKIVLVLFFFLIVPNVIFFSYLIRSYAGGTEEALIAAKKNVLEESGKTLDLQLQAFRNLSMSIYYNPLTRSYIDQRQPLDRQYVQELLSSIVNSEKHVVSAMLELNGERVWAGWNYRNADAFLEKYRARILELKGRPLWIPTEELSASFSESLKHFALGRAVNAPDRTVGLLLIFVSEDLIRYVMNNELLVGEGSSYYILDEEARVISSNHEGAIARRLEGEEAAEALRAAGRMGAAASALSFIARPGTDTETINVGLRSAESGWTSLLITDAGVVRAALAPIERTALLIFLFDVLFCLITWRILSDRVFKKIDLLASGMQAVSKGELAKIEPGDAGGEIGQLFAHYNYMVMRIGLLMEEVRREEQVRHEQELKVFSMQIGPHFLCNTLNTVKWMAVANKQQSIKQMIEALLWIMSNAIYGQRKEISIKEEIALLRHYLFIQKVRFEDFEAEISLPKALERYRICKFLLQPILENSILHGLRDLDRHGRIRISFAAEDALWVSVEDNGRGFDVAAQDFAAHEAKDRIGIRNVQERIRLLYGPDYGLAIESRPGEGTRIRIRLPLLPPLEREGPPGAAQKGPGAAQEGPGSAEEGQGSAEAGAGSGCGPGSADAAAGGPEEDGEGEGA